MYKFIYLFLQVRIIKGCDCYNQSFYTFQRCILSLSCYHVRHVLSPLIPGSACN